MNKNNIVGVRLNDDELADLQVKALGEGLKVSAYIRKLLLNAKPSHAVFSKAESRDFIKHIGKIGANINQLARAFNSGAEIDAGQILKMQIALDEMRDYIVLGKMPEEKKQAAEKISAPAPKIIIDEIPKNAEPILMPVCPKCGNHNLRSAGEKWLVCPECPHGTKSFTDKQTGEVFEHANFIMRNEKWRMLNVTQ